MELLSARGITKYFRDTRTLANDRVGVALVAGETRAVVGENGAGKSTLARVMAGLVTPDSGELRVRGRLLRAGSVRAAEAAGIGFVPQVSLLAGGLTVAENLILGREPRSLGFFVSRKKSYVLTSTLAERFGLRLDPDALVSSLTAAERRQADIARALARGGDILILDEPTSILSESESLRLFELLSRLAKAGKAILLITHRLSEVLKAADTITVLRDGAVVAEMPAAGADEARLAGLMARGATRRRGAGACPGIRAAGQAPGAASAGAPALELRLLRLAAGAAPFSLAVKPGEVLAVTALAGNGLGRLEDFASGMEAPREGEVLVAGESIASIPRERLRAGLLAYSPSDRERRGLCLPATVRDNVLALRRGEFSARDWLGRKRRNIAAKDAASLLGLEADPARSAASLSGGNRQRLLLSRELDRPRAALVLAEPLQGLDLASQAEATALIRELAALGSGVLLLTSTVEEALGAADRVIALYRGEAAFEGPNEGAATALSLLEAMTGASAQGSPP